MLIYLLKKKKKVLWLLGVHQRWATGTDKFVKFHFYCLSLIFACKKCIFYIYVFKDIRK